jgi:hypothetical protein
MPGLTFHLLVTRFFSSKNGDKISSPSSGYIRASCKSHFLCHSGESRNPELLENPGFRVALRLPGMTTSLFLRSFARSSSELQKKWMKTPFDSRTGTAKRDFER